VPLERLAPTSELDLLIEGTLGERTDRAAHSAILKDEDRCIRCALCAQRCPVEAILMERVTFQCEWRSTR
jgi:NAD-dependent dihydropyrimidine dehydrogenase PreA subunit